mmetsp:Transcript_25176/g.36843  ORF Transcript_25176/g.36843 Transcript_25176/m.36843 type:complete len:105 (-) Transcript_25176:606-920(-)
MIVMLLVVVITILVFIFVIGRDETEPGTLSLSLSLSLPRPPYQVLLFQLCFSLRASCIVFPKGLSSVHGRKPHVSRAHRRSSVVEKEAASHSVAKSDDTPRSSL